jgi:hypothetical protein
VNPAVESRFQTLINLLSPAALLLNFPNAEIDEGRPLAPGLRSVARITNGIIRYERSSLDHPLLNELQIGIESGAVERDEETGKLVVFLKTVAPFRSFQELNERLGVSEFEMLSEHTEVSTDPAHPTIFSYRGTIVLAAGEEVFSLATGLHVKLPMNVTCDVLSKGQGVYADRSFAGAFESSSHLRESGQGFTFSGSFKIHLA